MYTKRKWAPESEHRLNSMRIRNQPLKKVDKGHKILASMRGASTVSLVHFSGPNFWRKKNFFTSTLQLECLEKKMNNF